MPCPSKTIGKHGTMPPKKPFTLVGGSPPSNKAGKQAKTSCPACAELPAPPPSVSPPPVSPSSVPLTSTAPLSAAPSSSLPGGFKVGDSLVYTGENHIHTFVRDGRNITLRVRHGETCTVMGPAQVGYGSDELFGYGSDALSVRFFFEFDWGPAMKTYSVPIHYLRHSRIPEQANPRVIEPCSEVGYVEQQLNKHGFVDGTLQITSSEHTMHFLSGKMRRWSI